LAMIADTALQAEDFAQAFETSETMIDTVSHLCSSPDLTRAELNDAKEVCWVSCFQLGRQPEFTDVQKKLRLLGHALEFCPADRLAEILVTWRRLEKEDIDQRVEGGGLRRAVTSGQSRTALVPSLASKLQNIHLPASPLVMADSAAIADTFSRVASKFPFSDGQGQYREEVSAQASRALQKGIGWLIGADE